MIALDRLWSGDLADNGGNLLDVVFGWTDFAKLRRLVTKHCAAAGLTGARLDDFVLAVHEISANAIIHAETGRLILLRAAHGIRCLITDTVPKTPLSCPPPRSEDMRELCVPNDPADRPARQRPGPVAGRYPRRRAEHYLRPDSTVVSLYMRLD